MVTGAVLRQYHDQMDPGAELAAEILKAIGSGGDVWVFDHYVGGPDGLGRALDVLTEKLESCSDSDEAAFLTSIICSLENRGTP